MPDEAKLRKLRKQLEKAQAKGRDEEAIELLDALVAEDPKTPRWPHKLGDELRKVGQRARAIDCYSQAVDLYADQGFIARAIAMAKTVLNLDPTRIDILERVDPQAAQSLYQAARAAAAKKAEAARAQSAEPTPGARAPRADRQTRRTATARHPAVAGGPRHPAVLDAGPAAPGGPPPQTPTTAGAPPQAPTTAERSPQAPPAPPTTAARAPRGDRQTRRERPSVSQRAAPPPLPSSKPAAPATQSLPVASRAPAAHAMPPLEKPRARVRPITLGDLSLPPARPLDAAPAPPLPAPPRNPTVSDVYSSVLQSIDELSVAPQAGADEVRFSDAPPPERRPASIELDLSDIELGEPEPQVETDDAGQPTALSLSRLPLFPLFAELPRPALSQLVQAAELVELSDGEHLVRRGEPSDALFGIVEGQAKIMTMERDRYLSLGEGAVIGEACLLQDEPRSADVVADGKLTALRVPREALYEVVTAYPRLAEILLELLTRRLLGNLLQTSPLFRDFDLEGKQLLARSVEVRRAAAGTQLAEAGKRMDALYIALTGKVEVALPSGGAGLYGPGSMFGQDALLTGSPASCTVKAHVNMVVLRLSSERFLPVAMRHPKLIDKLGSISHEPIVNIAV